MTFIASRPHPGATCRRRGLLFTSHEHRGCTRTCAESPMLGYGQHRDRASCAILARHFVAQSADARCSALMRRRPPHALGEALELVLRYDRVEHLQCDGLPLLGELVERLETLEELRAADLRLDRDITALQQLVGRDLENLGE